MVTHSKNMVATCGMNCTYCYVHHKKKKPCMGCRESGEHKPASCRKCKIKDCVMLKSIKFCYECDEYPCVLVKRLDRSYQKRYQESLIRNMKIIDEQGMDHFLDIEKERLKCPDCEGILNIHDKICSDCGKNFNIEQYYSYKRE